MKESDNPMGLKGLAWLEVGSVDAKRSADKLGQLGFEIEGQQKDQRRWALRAGGCRLALSDQPESFASRFAQAHGGEAISAMGLRVESAQRAFERAKAMGATPKSQEHGEADWAWPAIEGVGGSLIYFIDEREPGWGDFSPRMEPRMGARSSPSDLIGFDHLTHNVRRGQMESWESFYREIFNFRPIRTFEIEGQATGLKSVALSSPDGSVKIPINESADDQSQIEEFIEKFRGEGIQHVALASRDIQSEVDRCLSRGVEFQRTPLTYWKGVDARLPGHGRALAELEKRGILIDGERSESGWKLLLQIFTKETLGPVFFELIERDGSSGFGEGNFKALFESIELDQIERGVIQLDPKERR